MGLYARGLITGRIFASDIGGWGGGLIFSGGLIYLFIYLLFIYYCYFLAGGGGGGGVGWAYCRNFTLP